MNQNLTARLSVNTQGRRRELNISREPVVIGTLPTCIICLSGKDGVAPIHARIERADGDTYVVAQSNSMVTKVNGSALVAGRRRKLSDGDQISVGKHTTIGFTESREMVTPRKKPKTSLLRKNAVFFAAVVCVTILAGLVILALRRGSKCSEVEVKLSPADSVIKTTVELQVTVPPANCINRIQYFLDADLKLDEENSLPYGIKIDPADPKLARLDRSIPHKLRLVIEDREGRKFERFLPYAVWFTATAGQPGKEDIPFVLGEDTKPTASPGSEGQVPGPNEGVGNVNNSVKSSSGNNSEAVQRINNLATFLSGKYDYALDETLFYEKVQRAAQELGRTYLDVSIRAQHNNERIRLEFSAQNLKPAFGYLMALSRSDFEVTTRKEGLGLWQLAPAKLKEEGFITAASELTDESKGPKVAARYTRSMYDAFENNLLLTVAFYDVSTGAAGELNANMARQMSQSERRSLPRLIKAGFIKEPQLARLIRFFAAAYVASYPWDFGIKTPSLSSIYG